MGESLRWRRPTLAGSVRPAPAIVWAVVGKFGTRDAGRVSGDRAGSGAAGDGRGRPPCPRLSEPVDGLPSS